MKLTLVLFFTVSDGKFLTVDHTNLRYYIRHMFRPTQHTFIKNEVTCFGYKMAAIDRSELKEG